MRLIPAIIIAVALILAPVIWVGLTYLMSGGGGGGGGTIDNQARIEIERLYQQLDDVNENFAGLQGELEQLRRDMRQPQAGPAPDTWPPPRALDDYAQVVLIGDRRNVNRGLVVATPSYLEERLGRPREVLGDTCAEMTNTHLASKLVTEQVGPIRVKMLKPAVESLRRVFENIEAVDPHLYSRINTAGSLCVRQIRNSQNRTSTHSFGLAVDLNIDGHLDTHGDGKTQLGLTILADFFHAEGWVWGASFGTEDSMHFEVSRRQLDEWLAAGIL